MTGDRPMDLAFSQAAQPWVNAILIWIGFGVLAGLLARLVLPGRDPSGPVGTIVIGVAGSTIGLLVCHQFVLKVPDNGSFNPISPLGMLAAAGGAFALLIVYRVLAACVRIDQPAVKDAEEAEK